MVAPTIENYNRLRDSLVASVPRKDQKYVVEFFAFMEKKLKRKNDLRKLDTPCFKTLIKYTQMLKNVYSWFKKPLSDITEKDFRKVYDDLEDGVIKSNRGEAYRSKNEYYNKIFKAKFFEMLGKDIIAKKVIEFNNKPKSEVRMIREPVFTKMLENVSRVEHRLLLWLAFDVGENITSLLQLKKRNCTRKLDPDTKDSCYMINFPEQILKRSRTPRTEPTIYNKTVELLDEVLENKDVDDFIFSFGYPSAKKFLQRLVRKLDIRVEPANDLLTWKDLRSSMACHLLNIGWTTDEVNARLGHVPGSQEIQKYVTYLALDRKRPLRRIQESQVQQVREELEKQKQADKLRAIREKTKDEMYQQQIDELKNQMKKINKAISLKGKRF